MRIAVFGIHPDDVELGCGGSVALAARSGHEVHLVDLTRGEAASNGTPETRAAEAERAAEILGCGGRRNLGLPDTALHGEDAAQVGKVAAAIREIRPHLVLAPTADDPHPDHAAGAELVRRAIYLAGVHGYVASGDAWKTPRVLIYAGRRDVRADVVVDISDVFDVKMAAIRAYDTQFSAGKGAHPTPLNVDGFLAYVESRDRVVGYRAGCRFGEAFELTSAIRIDAFDLFGEQHA